MTVTFQGKSPNKLWYTWQKTKGIFATKQHKPFAKNTAGSGLSATGTVLVQQQLAAVLAYLPLAVAGLGGMAAYNGFRAIRGSESDKKNKISSGDRWISAAKYAGAAALIGVLTPTAATWMGIALIGSTAFFGWKSFQSWQEASRSTVVRNYVRTQEGKWLDHKQQGNLRQRLARKLGNFAKNIKLGVLKATKWSSLTTAGAALVAAGVGAAQYYGAALLPAATASTITGAIATAGAALGLAAPAALTAAAVIVVAAIPVGIVAGIVAHNKIREIKAGMEQGDKPRFFKRSTATNNASNDDASLSSAPSPALSNDNKAAATTGFNKKAAVEAVAPVAEKPAAAASKEEDAEISEARKKAAEARRANKRNRKQGFS